MPKAFHLPAAGLNKPQSRGIHKPQGTGHQPVSRLLKKPKVGGRPKMRLTVDATGRPRITGRPPWSYAAKKISVNQNAAKGEVEDRRHLLHWDEQLKPVLESVYASLARKHGPLLHQALVAPLHARGWTRLPTTNEGVWELVSKEINGAKINLVPDRADTNKAIEHVRENLRRFAAHISGVWTPVPGGGSNDPLMKALVKEARPFFPVGSTDTPINARKSEIHAMILEMVDGSGAPCNLWQLIHDLTYSVTFDLSPKARRDQTSRTLAWQRQMLCNEPSDADRRYLELLRLLD
jgi:hypothetical protein